MMSRILLLSLLLCSGPLLARDVVSEGAGGGVNWTQGFIWADGYGVAPDEAAERKQRLLARRAAQVDAYRNLAEFIKGVRVSSETVVQQMVLDSDLVRTKIDAVIKGARMVKDHYQNEVAQVTLRVDMDGPLSAAVNRVAVEQDPATAWLDLPLGRYAGVLRLAPEAVLFPRAWAAEQGPLIRTGYDLEFVTRLLEQAEGVEPEVLLQNLEQAAERYRESVNYSGLLVDASAVTDFELATIPRIRDADGKVLYPRDELFAGALAARRPVSYDFRVDDAVRNERIAVTPYVIKAQGVYRSRNSDLVISDYDANFIRQSPQFREIIDKAGVMIVVAE